MCIAECRAHYRDTTRAVAKAALTTTWMNGHRSWTLMMTAVLRLAGAASAAPKAERRAPPCKPQAGERIVWPQGTSLWGTRSEDAKQEMSSVLVSLELGSLQGSGTKTVPVRLDGGRLSAGELGPQAL